MRTNEEFKNEVLERSRKKIAQNRKKILKISSAALSVLIVAVGVSVFLRVGPFSAEKSANTTADEGMVAEGTTGEYRPYSGLTGDASESEGAAIESFVNADLVNLKIESVSVTETVFDDIIFRTDITDEKDMEKLRSFILDLASTRLSGMGSIEDSERQRVIKFRGKNKSLTYIFLEDNSYVAPDGDRRSFDMSAELDAIIGDLKTAESETAGGKK